MIKGEKADLVLVDDIQGDETLEGVIAARDGNPLGIVVTGEAEVREIFGLPRIGKIAGCYVRNGVITRGSQVRFLRDGVVIWHGVVASLKRFKDDAREVKEGFECGIGLENFQDLKPGDLIETYEMKEIPRTVT